MKHSSAIAFLAAISLGTSAVDKKAKSDFSANWKKDTTFEKGENIRLASDQTASSVQQKVASQVGSNFVSVALNIRNQSPFKLGKPKTFARCGYQEDRTYLKSYKKHHHEGINPGFEEVFLFHNWGKDHVSSCGAVAWQVQEKKGESYKALETEGGHTLRLVVSWYQGYLACDNQGSPNKVTMRLEETPKSWSKEGLEAWYFEYDTYYKHANEKKTRVGVETDGSRVVFQSRDGVFARAQLTQGCQEILTVDITGPEQSSALSLARQQGETLTGTSSVTFVVLIAGLCAVTLFGLLLLVWRVKALGRKQRLQKDYLQDGSGDEVLKMNPDKVLSDQEDSDEEVMNISYRPRTVSFSDEVS